MKKAVSIGELKAYCDQRKPKKISYWSENQNWYDEFDTSKVRLTFPDIRVYENPNLVCLRSETGTIQFTRVRSAQIDTERDPVGTIVTLFCGSYGAQEPESTYTLMVGS